MPTQEDAQEWREPQPRNLEALDIGGCPVQPDQLDEQGRNEQDAEKENQRNREGRQVSHVLLDEHLDFLIIGDVVGENNPAAPEHERQQHEARQDG